MKRYRHIFGIMALLIFIAISGTPVPAADDTAGIDALIHTYYDCFVKEDLDGFLNTQVLETAEEREKVALMARDAWSAVGTRDMDIGPIEITLSKDKKTAVARYRASGTIFNKKTGESFVKEMSYIAMLAYQADTWKIERVCPESLFMDEVKETYERYLACLFLDKRVNSGNASVAAEKPDISIKPVSKSAVASTAVPESHLLETGVIDHIYTLIDRPSGSGVTSVENFHSGVDQVYVWFIYSNLKPGTVLKGVWLDEGRTLKLQEFPIIIPQKSGDAGFSIRRPLEGWVFGKYRVDLKSGTSTIGSVSFQITK